MERLEFEPFGERLVPGTVSRQKPQASGLLLRVGTGLFWLLVGGIVLARATYFESGIFDGPARVVTMAKRVTGVF